MVSQKEGVIVELRDEAFTLWASGWLAFRRKASKVFPGLNFYFLVLAEDEMEDSCYDGEDVLEVALTAPGFTILLDGPVVEAA